MLLIKWLFPALFLSSALICSTHASSFECRVDEPVYPDELYPSVLLTTSKGDITIELDRRKAPVTVNNFLRYVESGRYNGTVFHRVMSGFVVQGGGYNREFEDVESYGEIMNESGNGLTNRKRSVAMARHDDPHTATSQFYFNMEDNSSLDPGPRNWGYAVFGTVIEGWEVVELMASEPTGYSEVLGTGDVPESAITLIKAELVTF